MCLHVASPGPLSQLAKSITYKLGMGPRTRLLTMYVMRGVGCAQCSLSMGMSLIIIITEVSALGLAYRSQGGWYDQI